MVKCQEISSCLFERWHHPRPSAARSPSYCIYKVQNPHVLIMFAHTKHSHTRSTWHSRAICITGCRRCVCCWLIMTHCCTSLCGRMLTTTQTAHTFCCYACCCPSGGPGFESPRPTEAIGWLKQATTRFRVVLMDQRGTGRSSPITTTNLAARGCPQEQADYLAMFR